MTLTEQNALGFELNVSAQIVKEILKFNISATLARILTLRDFGLIREILKFTRFSGLFSGMGFACIDRSKTRNSFVLYVQE